MKNFKKIYTGSVKDIYESTLNPEELLFSFSDRYSIFDWGEMPDLIPFKGEALALFSHFAFEFLKSTTVHHAVGLTDSSGNLLKEVQRTSFLKVKKVEVHPPLKEFNASINYNYDFYKTKPVGCLVPLEVIFRFGVPEGSSLPVRLEQLQKKSRQHLQMALDEMNLKNIPQVNETWTAPCLEMTTKLEPTDRFLNQVEVCEVAGLSDEELFQLKKKTTECAIKLQQFLKLQGIQLWDGKFEFAFMPNSDPQNPQRDFALVDAIGPDELRLTFDGVQLSKEVLRKYYRQSPWGQVFAEAKNIAKSRGQEDWQKICQEELSQKPLKLPPEILQLISQMYCALTNLLSEGTGHGVPFKNIPSLSEVITQLKQRHL